MHGAEIDPAAQANGDVSALFGSCPLPVFHHKQIVLGHGSGGKLTAELIDKIFLPAFKNPVLDKLDDQAVVTISGARLAFTTDSFVVTPIFFPGGDIGRIAVNGTVNDLAMSGARPLYLSAAFILEEGLATDDLRRVVESMRAAAEEAGVQFVTGDTKVVNRGKGDQIFITTTGIGVIESDCQHLGGPRAPGRQDPPQRLYRRPWHGHHVPARGPGIRRRYRERLRIVERSGGCHAGYSISRGPRGFPPLPARPDPRRRGDNAE